MEVLLANPRGFCAGVERAIEIVERALARYGAPSTYATRSSTTASWWKACAPRAPSSSSPSTTCLPATLRRRFSLGSDVTAQPGAFASKASSTAAGTGRDTR
jgi:hypothetical protein